MNHTISTDNPLQDSHLRRSFCNGLSVLEMWFINSQSSFLPIIMYGVVYLKQWPFAIVTKLSVVR